MSAAVLVLAIGCGDGIADGDAGVGMDAAAADGGGSVVDAGSTDAASTEDGGSPTDDGGSAGDAGDATDAGGTTDAGALPDATVGVDAGTCTPASAGGSSGCEGTGLTCQCCPAGGPAMNCLCTTTCTADADCTDAARPRCNRPMFGPGGGGTGICTPTEYACLWGAICASPDTPIATPKGERAIASLGIGDVVWSLHEGALVPRPLTRVERTPVTDHAVVRVELATGRALEISAGHPTADGRTLGDLSPGDRLDGVEVLSVRTVPYAHAYTHDILPDSDTGTYVAGGVLIGSTLAPAR